MKATARERGQRILDALPDDASLDQIQNHLYVLPPRETRRGRRAVAYAIAPLIVGCFYTLLELASEGFPRRGEGRDTALLLLAVTAVAYVWALLPGRAIEAGLARAGRDLLLW